MCCRCNDGDLIEVRGGSDGIKACTGCRWHDYERRVVCWGGSSTTADSWVEVVDVCTWPLANAERQVHVSPVSGRTTETLKGYKATTDCKDHRKGACGREAKFFSPRRPGFDLRRSLMRSGIHPRMVVAAVVIVIMWSLFFYSMFTNGCGGSTCS